MKPFTADTILHIAPTPFFADRGCHIRIQNAVNATRQHGFRSIVCTYHHGRTPEGLDVRRIPSIPGYRQTTAGYSPFKFIADTLLFLMVIATVARERPRLIHAHLHEGALIGWAARTVMNQRDIPLVMDMQGSLSSELAAYRTFSSTSLPLRLFRVIERWICRMPDRFVCSSVQSRDLLHDAFGVPQEKAELVLDAVPPFFFDRRPAEDLRSRLGIPADAAVVVYTGSLLDGKGVSHLLAAMDRILAKCNNRVFFTIIGYPVDRVSDHIQKHDYADRCLLAGQVSYEQLPLWLSAADVALDPKSDSGGEASGKAMHYMAAGLPVICFDSRLHRMLVGDAGYFAAPADENDYAETILHALSDMDAARAKGRWGRRFAMEHYSLEAAGRRLAEVYRRLLVS